MDVTDASEIVERRNDALRHEIFGIAPSRVPWPLPPPRPHVELDAGVEDWRATALRVIDARLALYNNNSLTSRVSLHTTSTASTEANAVRGCPNRVLGVNELLEEILRNLAPCAQYAAWDVSVSWRRMKAYILRTSYRTPYPCPPYEGFFYSTVSILEVTGPVKLYIFENVRKHALDTMKC
jgi:hypothetical protein